ncbi:MAG: NusG domain II-containing protein [Clostridia bacterium]|nr:NusG domain II-containing protein [Clostridia bacterium]
MKKGDIIIISAVAAAFVLSIVLLISFSKQGSRVVIKQDNKIIYNKSINANETVDTGTNTVVIKDGIVYMSDATCKNQVCVNTGKISKKGESIVCLPNKVIVEIE